MGPAASQNLSIVRAIVVRHGGDVHKHDVPEPVGVGDCEREIREDRAGQGKSLPRRGDSHGQAAGQPRPEFRRGEDREPAVHGEVIQAVHRIDVVEQPPEFGHRSCRRRDRRRLVEPQRRPGGTRGGHHGGEHRNDYGVEPSGPNPRSLLDARKARRSG